MTWDGNYKELERLVKCMDMSLKVKAKIIHTIRFLFHVHRCRNWAVKKVDRGKKILFKMWCSRLASDTADHQQISAILLWVFQNKTNSIEKIMLEKVKEKGKKQKLYIDGLTK